MDNIEKITIDLNGPDGNAFVLMGTAYRLDEQLNMDPEQVIKDMSKGVYQDLVETFENLFGNYVTLIK